MKQTAKDVFLYLLMIIMLYVGVVSFLTILFQSINFQFPDPLYFGYTNISNLLRTGMSALVIVWPVFLLSSWAIYKDLRKHKEKREIWVRKWLLYLTLFIAALTVIIDLITLTNNFLGGELTTRFVLKVVSVLAVAVAVLWYFLWDLKRDASKKTRIPSAAAAMSSVVIAVWIVLGFVIVGSPATQRQIRSDEQRVSDLQNIQWQITNHWQQKGEIPQTLNTLNDSISGFTVPADPITGAAYVYTVKGETNFELCATFEHASIDDTSRVAFPAPKSGNENWNHDVGTICFDRVIDKDLYPPVVR